MVFAVYGHPRISKDHNIRCGIIDANGALKKCDLTDTGKNFYNPENLPAFDLNELEIAYETPEEDTVRLLTVAPIEPLRIAICRFPNKDFEKGEYYALRFKNGKWYQSEKICDNFSSLAPAQRDGSQTYVGGMEYYFGAGDSGNRVGDIDSITFTDRIFAARCSENAWVLESYLSYDMGKTYFLEQTIRCIPRNGTDEDIKIWRPTVPVFAEDNMPLYWHEGTYTAHTGGWHCDVNMYIEYDD